MYISLKWVQSLIGINNISISVLCEKLTLAGFEIEEILQKTVFEELDFILDVSLTANRSDICNVKGFTKELKTIFFNEKEFDSRQSETSNMVPASIFKNTKVCAPSFAWENLLQQQHFYKNKLNQQNLSNFESCYTFFSIESNSLNIISSPTWLKKCLYSSNKEPINNILDTLNFINLETGYPFFVYDLKKLEEYLQTSNISFSIRYPLEEQQIKIEEDKIFKLQPSNLLVYANEKPISILGISTIKEIEIDNNTTKVLIYGGFFDPVQIRKSSKVLGIRTDQSVSMEKNLNFNGLEQAFLRLTFLFKVQGITFTKKNLPKIEAISTLSNKLFTNYIEKKRPLLKLQYKEVKNLLGESLTLNSSNILNILKALDFQVLRESENGCELYIPSSREQDIEQEVDLIEEIVRISGFTNFLSIDPSFEKKGKLSKLEKLKRLLRKTFIEFGFNETLHYSISSFQTKNQLELKNPIVPEYSFFRSTLLKLLIFKTASNRKQKNESFEAFEIGRTYSKVKGKIIESEKTSGIFGGPSYRSDWNEEERIINWLEAKGLIEQIFGRLGIAVDYRKLSSNEMNLYHPGRSTELYNNNNFIGYFGQLHPNITKTHSLIDQTFIFEFNLEVIEKLWQAKQIYTYRPYSLFPVSLIDLAIIKNNKISFKEIQDKIWQVGGPLLKSVDLFDYYSGAPIPSGYHSLGFKLIFKNFDRTLTNEEVYAIVQKITDNLEKDFDITIRK